MRFFYVFTMIGAIAGGLMLMGTLATANGAPQTKEVTRVVEATRIVEVTRVVTVLPLHRYFRRQQQRRTRHRQK